MRPFSGKNISTEQRIFNNRLSRARRISENIFGIMMQQFRMFMRPRAGSPDNIARIILAACILHNFIQKNDHVQSPEPTASTEYSPVDGSHLREFQRRRGGENCKAYQVREQFKQFFNTENGRVEWQERRALLL